MSKVDPILVGARCTTLDSSLGRALRVKILGRAWVDSSHAPLRPCTRSEVLKIPDKAECTSKIPNNKLTRESLDIPSSQAGVC